MLCCSVAVAELLEQFVELVKDWLSRTLLMNIQDQNSIFEVKVRRLFVKQEGVGALKTSERSLS